MSLSYNFFKGCDGLNLYVDVLFAINFSMDFLSLFITAMIMHKRIHKRILISAIIGGLYSIFEILVPTKAVLGALINVLVSFLMCFIAFRENKIGRFTVMLLMFWATSASLGGIMSLLYNFLNSIIYDYIESYSYSNVYTGARFFIIVAFTMIISIVFTRIYSSKKDIREATLNITFNNKKYTMNGLCDSGNLLTEPITGRHVILISENCEISKEIEKMSDIKKRYIPYCGVDKTGLLKGMVPQKIYVNDREVSAIIAPIENKSFAGYEALIPVSLA